MYYGVIVLINSVQGEVFDYQIWGGWIPPPIELHWCPIKIHWCPISYTYEISHYQCYSGCLRSNHNMLIQWKNDPYRVRSHNICLEGFTSRLFKHIIQYFLINRKICFQSHINAIPGRGDLSMILWPFSAPKESQIVILTKCISYNFYINQY